MHSRIIFFILCFTLSCGIDAQPWQWLQKFGSASVTDAGLVCDVDNQGNLYTVSTTGSNFTLDTFVVNQPLQNLTVTRHSPSGQVDWLRQITAYGQIVATGIAVLPSGDYLISGYFKDTVVVGDTILISNGDFDTFLANFSSAGSLNWSVRGGGTGVDLSAEVNYSAFDNTIVWSGSYSGSITIGNTTIAPASIFREPVLVKFNLSGALNWYVRTAAFSPYGSVYATCIETSTGRIFMNANNSSTPRLFCFNASGVQQWVLNSTGGVGILGLKCNANGIVFMVGFYTGSSEDIGPISLPAVTGNSGFTAAINAASGTVNWVKTMTNGTTFAVRFTAVDINAMGQPIVCGFFQGGAIIDTTLMVTYQASGADGMILMLDQNNGSLIWQRQIEGDIREEMNDVSVSGNMVYSVGKASGNTIAGTDTLAGDANDTYNVIIVALNDCLPSTAHIVQPASLSFCSGDSLLLQANIQSGLYNWQWQINGLDIPGATLPYHYATVSGVYAVVIGTSGGCEQTSAYKSLISIPSPTSSFNSTIYGSNCNADSVQLNGYQIGSVSYQWLLNGNPISSANSSTYNAQQSGNYSLITTSNVNGCSTFSSPSNITIGSYPNLVAVYEDSICFGATTILAVSGASTYQWSPTQNLSSTTSSSPVYSALNSTTYQVIGATSGCYDTILLPMTAMPLPATPNISLTGAYLTSLNVSSGLQWQCNNVILPGYTSQAIIPPSNGSYQAIATDSITGCQSFSNTIVILNVGIGQNESQSIPTVSPNPMKSSATIRWGHIAHRASISIIDLQGKLCYAHIVNDEDHFELQRQQLSAGIYYCSLELDEQQSIYLKIIILDE